MMFLIKPENLLAVYELAIAANPIALRDVIERRLKRKLPIFLHASMANDPQAAPGTTGLEVLTKRTWSAFLGRDISDQEVHAIIAAFSDLCGLMKEIREVDNAKNN